MQCYALDAERRRCSATAVAGSDYCAAHAAEIAGAALPATTVQPKALNPLLARRRGNGSAPLPDGGKYDVPGWLKDAPTLQVIKYLQTSPDSMTRWMAAFILRKRRAVEGVEPLWERLHNDPVRFVRQQSAVALGKIGTRRVLNALIEGLAHDHDPGVREACAIALGNLGNPAAAPEIARVLEREENVFVRWDCIIALGQLGDRRVEKLLLRLQAEEIAQVLREACRDSLAEIHQRHRALA